MRKTICQKLGPRTRHFLGIFIHAPFQCFHRVNLSNYKLFKTYQSTSFFCPTCGSTVQPQFNWPNRKSRKEHQIGLLREDLFCPNCSSWVRIRTLAYVLLEHLNSHWSTNYLSIAQATAQHDLDFKILDTDNFSPIDKFWMSHSNYYRSSYLPQEENGKLLEKNVYNVDLQNIPFPDQNFDMVLSSDVMEHVRDADLAHREIQRVLKTGGVYIFTAPFDPSMQKNRILVNTETENDIFLCKPHYHGDPLSNGIIAYRVFGQELISDLESIGFEVNFRYIQSPRHLIIDGDCFVAIKK